MKKIKGRLFIYYEQGMKGGELCFQDLKYIKLESIKSAWRVDDGNKAWHKDNIELQGIILNCEVLHDGKWLPFCAPITKDKDYEISSLFCGEWEGDLEADKRLAKKYNFKIKYAVERLNEEYGVGNWKLNDEFPHILLNDGTLLHIGSTPETIPNRPYGIAEKDKVRFTVKWDNGIIEYKKTIDDILVETWDFKGFNVLKKNDYLIVLDEDSNIINKGYVNQIPLRIFSDTFDGHFPKNSNWGKYFEERYYVEVHREKSLFHRFLSYIFKQV